MDSKCQLQSASPQKRMKIRSKSTEQIQQAKMAFHTPQKSLPTRSDQEEDKVTKGSDAPLSLSEEPK